jgi:hypothetical protein
MKTISLILTIMLIGCGNAEPITDKQVELVSKRCTELGMSISIVNDAHQGRNEVTCDEVGK